MKMSRSALNKPLALATGVFLAHGAHATTRVTFGGFTNDNVSIPSIAGFGSFVSATSSDYLATAGVSGVFGTPAIGLTWGVGYESYTAWDGRGNVGQLDYNANGFGNLDLVFTPNAGNGVLVTRFDLDEWAGGANTVLNWSVFDSIGTLASGVWAARNTANDPSDLGGRDIILTGLTAGNVNINQAVTLRFTYVSGAPSYMALDNLTFDQVVVPEPGVASLALLGAGLGAMAMRRRKQS